MVKFSRKNVSLSAFWVSHHDKLSDFYASSCQRGDSPLPMLVVRAILASIATAVLVWSLVEMPNPRWLIYLTNWGILLMNLLTWSGLLISMLAMTKNGDHDSSSSELPWYVSCYWFIFNVAISIAFVITALYWSLLYSPDAEIENLRLYWLDIFTHGFNSVLAIIEVLVSRTPVRIAHVYQPLGLGLWYAAFSVIYYAAGGTDGNGLPYIYAVLDWRERAQAGTIVAVAAVGVILIYLVVWGLAWTRDKVTSSALRTTSHNLPYTPEH